ncbi:MAG TPA: prepilin-type N-terminal cleavage/methylation domain-containing protein, partial [Epsilonproteobacteria bacterium]|nr:prepilin-type N-terminal cleavage/methylation domain-containing protein [Campylobacterota bacterium]
MPYKIDRIRKAFSLVELLIVILIISLVYFLGFSN